MPIFAWNLFAKSKCQLQDFKMEYKMILLYLIHKGIQKCYNQKHYQITNDIRFRIYRWISPKVFKC